MRLLGTVLELELHILIHDHHPVQSGKFGVILQFVLILVRESDVELAADFVGGAWDKAI